MSPDSGSSSSGVTWTIDAAGRATILFDTPGQKVNLIDPDVLTAVGEAIAYFMRRGDVKSLVIASAKPGTFVAGVDVKQVPSVKSVEEGRRKAIIGQNVWNAIAAAPFPTAAAIAGACLGGGLELALACNLRVAADADEVQIGLPEVRLGIVPGWGGTQRLPRLVGLPLALQMILTGRSLSAREAKRARLVDAVVPAERVLAAARELLARGKRRRSLGAGQRLLFRAPFRHFILSRAAASARKATGGHYPAPFAAIDAIGWGLAHGIAEGLAREADLVGGLVTGPVSRNLVRVFLAMRAGEEDAPGSTPVAAPRSIGILGAGVMGGAIAAVAAGRGLAVRLRDVAAPPLARGLGEAHSILSGRGSRRRPKEWTIARFHRISPSLTLDGFEAADFVLEAVVEDLEIKRAVLADLEPRVSDACVLATNTSSLSVADIGARLARPDRFVGLHFFNPADRMPLVEIVRGPATSPHTVAVARALAKKMGKTPVVVSDAPGFVVNRLLMPYLAESLQLLAAGGDVVAIDRALERFGMPMGPFALLDQIGLDVAAKVSKVLSAAFGDHLPEDHALAVLAGAGSLGVKSGAGFYAYASGKRRGVREAAVSAVRGTGGAAGAVPGADAAVTRLLYPMINEAARILDEGVAPDARTVDVAMILGTGFPPFLGGPLRWADGIGAAGIARALAASGLARLAPCARLSRMAADGSSFHAGG
ncbi:MAG: enoyl-CoA hydratase/isomerase family protein [Acidobacteria bacterium]|nr:enoyl-CoA hydratase/isomerase family protein [Acidobacteriota bacterium]